MKIKTLLFFFIITISYPKLFALQPGSDTVLPFPKDSTWVESMSYDSKTYHQFKQDKFFDYSDNHIEGYSIWEMLLDKLRRFLSNHLSIDISPTQTKIILWVVSAIVLITIFLLLWFFKPSLFFRNKKQGISFTVEEENIHELNFTDLTKNALKSEQYSEAIRWEYLRLLKILHDKDFISWSPYKTVNEYVNEMKHVKIKADFKEVSFHFLCFRYGNFEASQTDWDSFVSLTKNITKQV